MKPHSERIAERIVGETLFRAKFVAKSPDRQQEAAVLTDLVRFSLEKDVAAILSDEMSVYLAVVEMLDKVSALLHGMNTAEFNKEIIEIDALLDLVDKY